MTGVSFDEKSSVINLPRNPGLPRSGPKIYGDCYAIDRSTGDGAL
jgi:hypothetical protein